MEKIDINKIRGVWRDFHPEKGYSAGGDDTIESIKLVAEKVNEIIDRLTTPSQ